MLRSRVVSPLRPRVCVHAAANLSFLLPDDSAISWRFHLKPFFCAHLLFPLAVPPLSERGIFIKQTLFCLQRDQHSSLILVALQGAPQSLYTSHGNPCKNWMRLGGWQLPRAVPDQRQPSSAEHPQPVSAGQLARLGCAGGPRGAGCNARSCRTPRRYAHGFTKAELAA